MASKAKKYSRAHSPYYRKNASSTNTVERDTTAIANRPTRGRLLDRQKRYEALNYVTDNRNYTFDNYYPTTNTSGWRNVFEIPPMGVQPTKRRSRSKSFSLLSPRVAISDPNNVVLCIRRARRRAVIHAKGIAGTRVNKPKPSRYSQFKCR